ncbi:MAG TPA: class I SAM-dependent methyltransferase, partial [Dongiaceae bacterium]|nr:class I SAM-dependent methyltransferase [Dongiaceae bacterium]
RPVDTGELERMAAFEEWYWWHRGRRTIVRRILRRYASPQARILDVGCGTGATTAALADFGRVSGLDVGPAALRHARARGLAVARGSAERLPIRAESLDVVVALDVIEHLDDDLGALRELRRVVAPGGALLVTVPAYGWLWSGHDELNHHRRRYTRRSLQTVTERAGWRQVRTTYFNSLLLPVAIALRVLDRFNRKTTQSSLDLWVPPEPFNWLLERPLAIEASVIARGGRIPAGLSLLAVFR